MNRQTLSAIFLAAFAGAALAAAPAFEDVDKNSDGQLSAEEVAVIEGFDFTAADANEDGWIDSNEYQDAAEDL